jgi:hypothetical protein
MGRYSLNNSINTKRKFFTSLHTDRSDTFKASGEASFNLFSANVHHSSFNLAASLSCLQEKQPLSSKA